MVRGTEGVYSLAYTHLPQKMTTLREKATIAQMGVQLTIILFMLNAPS